MHVTNYYHEFINQLIPQHSLYHSHDSRSIPLGQEEVIKHSYVNLR